MGDAKKGKNARDVWTIAPKSIRNSHIAVFPPDIPKKCILAGSRPKDLILDPFSGSGTTCRVAAALGRRSIGIELNSEFHRLAEKMTFNDSSSLEEFL